jgi:asparagine synthase (glutamine-hydrolysing)
MCGIAGIFSFETIRQETIESMTGCLAHRGPDANGTFLDKTNTIALGHTRLSIIDLSNAANQPFYSSDNRYAVVFNGEIYNFNEIKKELISRHSISFRTHSDTEVILEAFAVWKSAMVNKLDGMFAIAIADQHERKLYLFRDRIGKKPLYYFTSGSLFVFGSEIKALLKHPVVNKEKIINRGIVNTFLHLGYIPEPHTIYTNIYKFPAGHFGEVDRSFKLISRPYWQVAQLNHNKESRVSTAKENFTGLLENAVSKRLISDVPIGAFLSGGTDSSLITAIASKHVASPLKTFSIGFQESKFDERFYANAVAQHLNTDHTEYVLHEKEAVDILETYLHNFDEPFADTSAIPTMLVSKLACQQVKVVLTGDGGDELFQGYGSYTWANRLASTPWKLLRGSAQWALNASGKSRYMRIADLLRRPMTGKLASHIFSQEQYLFSQDEVKDKLLKHTIDFLAFDYEDPVLSSVLSEGEKQAIFDLQFYLKDDLLVKVDRASMHYALECRSPLLDHHVIEYALSLDKSLKVRDGKTKWLLKELLGQHLPQKLVHRPKWGFSVPLAKWLKGDLRYLLNDFLNDDVIESVGLFKPAYIHQLKKEFLSGIDYRYNRLWALIVLHKWWKENVL